MATTHDAPRGGGAHERDVHQAASRRRRDRRVAAPERIRGALGRHEHEPGAAGTFTFLDRPGAANTEAQSVNGAVRIVGSHEDPAMDVGHGFLYSGGLFTTIDVPGSAYTIAFGINDAGQVVGQFTTDNSIFHGFLYSAGAFTPFEVPGALAMGISA